MMTMMILPCPNRASSARHAMARWHSLAVTLPPPRAIPDAPWIMSSRRRRFLHQQNERRQQPCSLCWNVLSTCSSHYSHRRQRRRMYYGTDNEHLWTTEPGMSFQSPSLDGNEHLPKSNFRIRELRPGPSTQFGIGSEVGSLADSSTWGVCGSTVVLTTMVSESSAMPPSSFAASSLSPNANATTTALPRKILWAPSPPPLLTVDYRERSHAVGAIPAGRSRRDNLGHASGAEVLASRAVDRALRPLLVGVAVPLQARIGGTTGTSADAEITVVSRFHVTASVQACDPWGYVKSNGKDQSPSPCGRRSTSGNPVALAINATAVALSRHLVEPVAAVHLTLFDDGTMVLDAPPSLLLPVPTAGRRGGDDASPGDPRTSTATPPRAVGHLLYAGTRNSIVMMEWTSLATGSPPSSTVVPFRRDGTAAVDLSLGLPEPVWSDMVPIAHACLHPLLDRMEECWEDESERQQSARDVVATSSEERAIRDSLGLSDVCANVVLDEALQAESPSTLQGTTQLTDAFVQRAVAHCEERIGNAALRLFGWDDKSSSNEIETESVEGCQLHSGTAAPLLSKQLRGRRERIVSQAISKLANEFLLEEEAIPSMGSSNCLAPLSELVSKRVLQRALGRAAVHFGCRADGRGNAAGSGWKTVRPIQVQAPALPDTVHGSAFFARGETKVLCTVTLGAPREGLPRMDPYQLTLHPSQYVDAYSSSLDPAASNDLPVGSLRYLRSQEALLSDLNTRHVRAGREETGDSGSLYEYQRCFLQYDFPPYSTGSIPTGSGASLSSSNSNRRSIGHGKLAERAILAVLPPPHEFPYAIRVTSEVTDSNGSSSMASVCGASLALLDAGVPLRLPVAGASVGLVRDEANQCRLLIDITGTEDHYGLMDMKVAGTTQGVTALQLDVKEPLPLSVVLDALALAKSGREAILKETENLLGGPLLPRPSPKASAPRATIVRFDPQRKRDLVGPGGAVLRQMEDRYGVSLDLTQEGQCLIFGPNPEAVARARRTVMDLVADVVEGEVYTGVVVEIKDFGAIVELLRNKEGLLHVSEISHEEGDASDPRRHRDGVPGFLRRHLRVGQEIEVMCIGVDRLQGTIKLSRKALFRRRTSQ